MIASEKLLELSSINGCATASEHFCSITQSGGQSVIRTYGEYPIEYIPGEDGEIEYLNQESFDVEYIPEDDSDNIIEYIPEDSQGIEYINENIEIEYLCDK